MAKVKVKNGIVIDKGLSAMHPDLPYVDAEEDAAKAKAAADAANPPLTMETLQAQVAALQAQLDQRQTDMMAMLSTPTSAAAVPPKVEALNTDGLPDPTADPDGYAKEMMARTMKVIESQRNYDQWVAEQQSDAQTRNAALWQDFQSNYPDYAGDFDKVEIAATRVAKRAAARKIDVEKYMYGQSDRFMKDVVKEMETFFGKPAKADPDDTPDDDEPEIRTAGMFGGNESGGKPAKGAEGPDADPFKDVRDFQMRTGFHA